MLRPFLTLFKTPTHRQCLARVPRRLISRAEVEAQTLLDELYTTILAQRFENIVVIQTKFNANPRYIILANAFSSRHLVSGTEMVNKQYKNSIKTPDQEFARLSISSDWNVMDFDGVVVHLFSQASREQFDIEQLWAVGEEYDDLTNFPPLPESPSSSSLLLS